MGHKYKITTNTQTTNKIHSSVISRRMLYYNSTNVYMSSQAENFRLKSASTGSQPGTKTKLRP